MAGRDGRACERRRPLRPRRGPRRRRPARPDRRARLQRRDDRAQELPRDDARGLASGDRPQPDVRLRARTDGCSAPRRDGRRIDRAARLDDVVPGWIQRRRLCGVERRRGTAREGIVERARRQRHPGQRHRARIHPDRHDRQSRGVAPTPDRRADPRRTVGDARGRRGRDRVSASPTTPATSPAPRSRSTVATWLAEFAAQGAGIRMRGSPTRSKTPEGGRPRPQPNSVAAPRCSTGAQSARESRVSRSIHTRRQDRADDPRRVVRLPHHPRGEREGDREDDRCALRGRPPRASRPHLGDRPGPRPEELGGRRQAVARRRDAAGARDDLRIS